MHKLNYASICRVYAEELLDEPAVSKCLRAAADEIDLLNKSEKTWAEDSAETDTVVRDAARKVLPAIKVDGDSYHVPSIEDIVELLVAEVERLRLETSALMAKRNWGRLEMGGGE